MSARDAHSADGPGYYPVYLDLRGRVCLVVGGGPIAAGKVRGLLDAGARVTVVSPELSQPIRGWHAQGRVTWEPRRFVAEDITGAFLVVAATDDRHANAAIYDLADRAGCVANAVDDLDHCNFIAPAVARAGRVQVAVSTAGQSPALAKRVRDRVAREILTPSVGTLSAFLGAWRPRVKATLDGYERRQAFWEGVLDGCLPQLIANGELVRADRVMAECLQRATAPRSPDDRCAAGEAHPGVCRACVGAGVGA